MTIGKTACLVCETEFDRREDGVFVCSYCNSPMPELPQGFSVFEPQGADGEYLVLRTPDGETHRMETERAHDLALLLVARTKRRMSETGGHSDR